MNARELFELAKKNDLHSAEAFNALLNIYKISVNQDVIQLRYYLGECYFNGYGVARDTVIATDYFTRAADYVLSETSDSIALQNLANLRLADIYIETNRVGDASEHLLQAAQHSSKATKYEGKEGSERLQKLASQHPNNPDVLINYGVMLKEGYVIQTNLQTAYACFQRARELKGMRASFYLGKIHLTSYHYDRIHQYQQKNPFFNQQKAYEFLLEAAQAGNPDAFEELKTQAQVCFDANAYVGLCYEKGWGTVANSFAAVNHYQAAIADPNKNKRDVALAQLAEAQLTGQGGVAKDVKAAIESLNQAIIANTTNVYGTVYAMRRMRELSVSHPQEATVHYYLGTYYRDSTGTTADRAKAMECFQKAAELGHADSMISLYHMHDEDYRASKARGITYLESYKRAVAWLYNYLDHPQVSQDKKNNFFNQLANHMMPTPYFEIGLCLQRGYGCTIDPQRAIQNFSKAIFDSRAVLTLAEIYENQGNLEGAVEQYAILAGDKVFSDVMQRSGFEAIRRLAEAHPDNAAAQHAYARCLEKGHGCNIDLVRAAERYTTVPDLLHIADVHSNTEAGKIAFARLSALANAENPDAVYALAQCHEAGHSTPVDPKKAFDLFSSIIRTAFEVLSSTAREIHPQSCNLARMKVAEYYIAGQVVPRDLYKAGVCLKIAARDWAINTPNEAIKQLETLTKVYRGDGAIQNAYGLCLHNGHGTPINKEQANKYFFHAAALGYPSGLFNYGASLEVNDRDRAIDFYLRAARGGSQLALQSITRLSNADIPAASLALAECYVEGHILPSIPKAAVPIYEGIINRHANDVAMIKLARLYLEGREGREGIPRDLTKALGLLDQAVTTMKSKGTTSDATLSLLIDLSIQHPNNGYLFRILGNAYLAGVDGKVDHKKAFECFTHGASLDNATCLRDLAVMYWHGQHVKQDHKQFLSLYYQYLQKPNDADDQHKADRFGWLRNNLANIPHDYELGMCYLNGYGTPILPDLAMTHLKKASKAGDERAHCALGEIYEKGLANQPVDLVHAINHYITSAHSNGKRAEGSAKALEALTRLHTATPDNMTVHNALVKCHEQGLGTPVDALQVAAAQRRLVDKVYLDIDNKPITSNALGNHLIRLRTLTTHLTATIYNALRAERARLLTAQHPLESPEVQRINRLIDAATALNRSDERPDLLIRSANALASLKSDASPYAKHLQVALTRQQQILTFLRQFRADMLRLRAIVWNPDTKWYVEGWVKKWAEGMPNGIEQLRRLLNNVGEASDTQLLTLHGELCVFHNQKAATKSAEKRHESTDRIYTNLGLLLIGTDFNSFLPEPVVAHEPIEMKEFVPVLQPPAPSAPQLSSTAYVLNQSQQPPLALSSPQSGRIEGPFDTASGLLRANGGGVVDAPPFYPMQASSAQVDPPPAYVAPKQVFSYVAPEPVIKEKAEKPTFAKQAGPSLFSPQPAAPQPQSSFSFSTIGNLFGKIANLFKPVPAAPAAPQFRANRAMEMNQFFNPNSSAAPEQNQPPRYVAPQQPVVSHHAQVASLLSAAPKVRNAPEPSAPLLPPPAPIAKQAALDF